MKGMGMAALAMGLDKAPFSGNPAHAAEAGMQGECKLPPLPYAHDALEPYIDRETLQLHHGKHHAAYVKGFNTAMEELEKGKTTIETLSPVSTPIYEFEKIRSLQHLSQVISQVHDTEDHIREPKGFKARLVQELSKAVENEDYERAARLRDRIKRLE